MTRLRIVLQLSLSALVAAASGGLILALLLAVAALGAGALTGVGAGELAGGLPVLTGLALIGGMLAIIPAVALGWAPAFAAGALLWMAGRTHAGSGGQLEWAVAGASAAMICYLRIDWGSDPSPPLVGAFAFPPAALAGAFLLTGAAAGQVFRSTMAALAPFLYLDDPPGGEERVE